jgi:hypothetical protein
MGNTCPPPIPCLACEKCSSTQLAAFNAVAAELRERLINQKGTNLDTLGLRFRTSLERTLGRTEDEYALRLVGRILFPAFAPNDPVKMTVSELWTIVRTSLPEADKERTDIVDRWLAQLDGVVRWCQLWRPESQVPPEPGEAQVEFSAVSAEELAAERRGGGGQKPSRAK